MLHSIVLSRHVLYQVVETCIHYNPRNTALTQGTLVSQIYWLVDLVVYKKQYVLFFVGLWAMSRFRSQDCLRLSCFWFSWFFWSLWSGATWNLGPIPELPFSWIPWTHLNTTLPFVRSVPCKFHEEARIHHPNFMLWFGRNILTKPFSLLDNHMSGWGCIDFRTLLIVTMSTSNEKQHCVEPEASIGLGHQIEKKWVQSREL